MSQARSRLERVGGDRLIAALGRQSWLRGAVGRRAITLLGALFIFLANLLAYSLFSGGAPLLDILIAFGLTAVPGAVLVYRSYQLPSTDIDPRFHAVVGTVPGEGSTFSFTMPATDDANDGEDRPDGRARQVVHTDG